MSNAIEECQEYWRKRAEETRTLADSMKDKEAKQTMLGIADNYECLAKRVEERAKVAGSDRALVPTANPKRLTGDRESVDTSF